MSGADVLGGGILPLVRFPTLFPGQMGVPGTDSERGLRVSSTGAVFYVDPNYPGASDARDGTLPTDPLLTVQTAINRCESYRNDVIVVGMNAGYGDSPGTPYPVPIQESVTLNKHGVRLIGASPSVYGVPWGPATAGTACITVTGADCLIEGFGFTGNVVAGNGIYAEWNSPTLWADNLTIRHCLFDVAIDTAIELEFTWYVDIHHCRFINCDEYGIYIDPAGAGISFAHIHDNWFKDCALGALSLEGCDDSKIEHNNIYDTAAATGLAAADQGINTDGGSNNIVAHNTLSCLLPGPGNGDYNDFCSPDAAAPNTTDVWIQNFCVDGPSVTNPT